MAWSEAKVHAWLAEREARVGGSAWPPDPRVGSRGHDAAVLGASRANPVLCVDQTIEGVHFVAGTSPDAVGHKAAGRALSDLAATAARPVALLLALRAPKDRDEADLEALIDSVDRAAAQHGARLVGGDLACAPGPLALTVSAHGELPVAGTAPGRDRARAGQVLVCTGPLGGSALGRHLAIEPRVAEGRWLHELGATAMMDVSDGLGIDAERMARASGVRITLQHVPIHPDAERTARTDGRTAFGHALTDGEDHELLATLDRDRWEAAFEQGVARFGDEFREAAARWTVLGRVEEGEGLWVADGGEVVRWQGTWSDGGRGYVHGE